MGRKITKIVSLNVNGLNMYQKRRKIFRYIRGKDPDMVFLQETYSSKAIEKLWSNEWGRRLYFSHGTTNSRGVACLLSHKFDGQIEGFWNDKEGRFLALQCKISDRSLLFINVYAPNEDNPEFFHQTFNFLDTVNYDYDDIVLLGDWNTVLNLQEDKRGSEIDNHSNKRRVLVNYLEHYQLTDIWRSLHPGIFQFSWKRMEPRVTMSRLDYFLISNGLLSYVVNAEILPSFITNHGMITLDLCLEDNPRGPGYWKLNSTHLKDPEFINRINSAIDQYNEDVASSTHTRDIIWEGLKSKLIAEAMDYSIKKAKGKSNVINVLQNKLIKLDQKLAVSQSATDIKKVKRDIK